MNVRGLILTAVAVVFALTGCLTRPETDKTALGERRIVGYFPAAAIALEQYNPGLEYLTHINLWFFNYDRKGEISSPRVSTLMLKRFIAEAHGEQTKVFVSIGGGHVTARTEAGRRYLTLFREKNFEPIIEALIRFADSTGIDGIDLDFEGDMMVPEYSDFIIELADAIADKPYQLSGAFGYWGARKMRDAAVTSFDFLNLMIYNESGLFDKELKDHSSFAHVEKTVADRSKLVIGVPFYGWQRTVDADGRILNEGSITYREISENYPEQSLNSDFLTLPTEEGGRTVITFNSLDLIRKKSHYARSFGGIMAWHIAQDTPDLSLLQAVYLGLID